jgi:DNA topoisomerase-1
VAQRLLDDHRRTRGNPEMKPSMRQAAASAPDAVASAKAAGLRYVTDSVPGIRRIAAGKKFAYVGPNGRRIRDAETLTRIRSLVVPPAWTNVWICPLEHGHIQVTARDARGRKQYRYHARWRKVRDETKYEKLAAFGRALPLIRRKVHADLSRNGLPREKVLGAVVRLLESTFIRVGNEKYARDNGSFGLTTLRGQHVQIKGERIKFRFRGKSGKHHEIELDDRRIAAIIRRCRELPGYELFQYLDENGEPRVLDSGDVNEYLRALTGEDYTAKDFRTWAGTVLATLALQEFERFDSATQAKRNVVRAIERVASRLGNTPSICRKCYIHPRVIDSYLDGTMVRALKRRAEKTLREDLYALKPQEAAVLGLLQQRLQREPVAKPQRSERKKANAKRSSASKKRAGTAASRKQRAAAPAASA